MYIIKRVEEVVSKGNVIVSWGLFSTENTLPGAAALTYFDSEEKANAICTKLNSTESK